MNLLEYVFNKKNHKNDKYTYTPPIYLTKKNTNEEIKVEDKSHQPEEPKYRKQYEPNVQEIIDEYYLTLKYFKNYLKKIGLIKSDAEFNKFLGKSRCYFLSSEQQNHVPTFKLLNEIIQSISMIENNLQELIDDNFNSATIQLNLRKYKDKMFSIRMKYIYYIMKL